MKFLEIWDKIKNLRGSEEKLFISLGVVGVIGSTESSLDSGVNDKFNKIIILYENAKVDGNEVKWGRKIDEIPYTEEEVKNLIKLQKIPIVERKVSNEFEFLSGPEFGRIIQ